MGCKNENVKLEGAQRDHGDAGYLSFDNGIESKGENNAGEKAEDDIGGESKDDIGGEGEDNDGREGGKNDVGGEGEDDNDGEGKDDTSRTDETLNEKSKVGDADEISNLGKIAASQLTFGCIANPLVDTLALGIVVSDHLVVSALGSVAFSFLAPGCLTPGPPILPLPGLPAFPYLGSFVVPLVGLDTFLHDLSLAPLIDGSTVKLLTEVIANLFVIAHPPYNGFTSEQTLSIFFEVGVVNLFSGVNAIFDAWSQYSSGFGSIVSAMD